MVAAVAALTSGCSSGSSPHVRLAVTPARAVFDVPVSVSVHGLAPDEHATLTASAVDDRDVTWHSSATFVATSSGVVDTTQAPVFGSYRGVDPMGIFDRMQPSGGDREGGIVDETFISPLGGYDVTVDVRVKGHMVAHTTVQRIDPQVVGVHRRSYLPKTDGIDADLYLPGQAAGRRPAVLVFGGSEGGMDQNFEAQLLASHGYPAMSLAYFKAPGLPATLRNIPLEYFVKALRVLRRAPGVDPHRVVVWGISRGSEAALLLGVHFPALVDGVVAGVPSSVVNGSFPSGGAAWTLGGHPLPFVPLKRFGDPTPHDRRAVIPVEKVRGPILLICGGEDLIWPSCRYSDAIVRRMAQHGKRSRVTELSYPTAGHYVGIEIPYVSSVDASLNSIDTDHGGTVAGNTLGRIDAWQHILTLLAQLR